MAEISKVKLPDGSTYDIKDATARSDASSKVSKAGDTMTGKLSLKSNQYTDAYNSGALDLQNSNIDGVNSIYTADASDNAQEGIHFYRDSTHVDSLYAQNGNLYFAPNRKLGENGTPKHVYFEGASVYEADLEWGAKNITGGVTPVGASLSTEHSANRLAFLDPEAIDIEYTTDGGVTWTDSGYADADKTWVCTGTQFIAIGQSKAAYSASAELTTNHWTRVTLTGQNGTKQYVYTNPRKLLVNMSTALAINCLIEYKTGVSGAEWKTFGTYAVTGWSGWNEIPLILSTFGGGTTQTSNYWYLRFTFKVNSTRTDSYKGMAGLYGLRLFGTNNWGSASSNYGKGPISATGHLYSYDSSANASFPANVTATQFIGALNGNANTAGALTLNTQVTGSTVNDFKGSTFKVASIKSITISGLAGSDGTIMWIPWSSSYGRQLIFDDTTNKVFSRYLSNGTWGAWEDLSKPTGTSPISVSSSNAISIATASTSGYGATKLSTATNSTATDVAATPSAVKTAYDLANSANTTANTALSGVNGNLIYDHTFTISNGVATFTPHVYQKGQEVTTNYAASCFTWKYRLIDGSEVNLTTKSNRGCDVTISNMGYGGHVIGIFTPS